MLQLIIGLIGLMSDPLGRSTSSDCSSTMRPPTC